MAEEKSSYETPNRHIVFIISHLRLGVVNAERLSSLNPSLMMPILPCPAMTTVSLLLAMKLTKANSRSEAKMKSVQTKNQTSTNFVYATRDIRGGIFKRFLLL